MAKNNKKITLAEFRAWLEGVEELQPRGWTPDSTQWKRIRDKINSIEESSARGLTSGAVAPQQRFQAPVQGAPSMLPPPAPPVQGGVPNLPVAPQGKLGIPVGPDGKIKTPDIDTSDGKFKSSFV